MTACKSVHCCHYSQFNDILLGTKKLHFEEILKKSMEKEMPCLYTILPAPARLASCWFVRYFVVRQLSTPLETMLDRLELSLGNNFPIKTSMQVSEV